jgi:hypothetical protein
VSAPAKQTRPPIYGFLAEFADQHDLLDAIQGAKREGYTVMEAYTPLPIEEVSHALGAENRLPLIVLAGGAVGCIAGFLLQYYVSVVDYPLNVGGRPHNSWPAFVIVTFETTILCAALAAVLGMLALNRLPQPYHPVFNVPLFELASRNRFFLMLLSRDPRFDLTRTRELLQATKSLNVAPVPH